jgi:LCP family protein required for cell wall assembly
MAVQTATGGAQGRGAGGRRAPAEATSGKRQRSKRYRAPVWTKVLTAAGGVLLVLSISGIVGSRYFLNKLTGGIETTTGALGPDSSGNSSAGSTKAGKLPTGAMNLLMLGLDTRVGWDAAGKPSRSDTILVMHITAAHDRAYMISIPRDTLADIPADKTLNFNGASNQKINSAYEFGSRNGHGWTGGSRLAAEAVHKLTGLGFDGLVVIDFDGFKGMLEAMGGVYMCVDKDVWSSHYTVDGKGKVSYAVGADPLSPPRNALWFRKGCRNMAAWEALEFSRIRHSANGDYDRQRHQQQLLRAMAKKATSAGVLSNPSKVAKILDAAGASLKVDAHGVPINDFIFGLKGLAGADLIPIKTNSGSFQSVKVSGQDYETLSDETKNLFKAAADDRLDDYIFKHPEVLINEGSAG